MRVSWPVCCEALSDVPTTRRVIGSGPVRTLARWCLVRSLLKEALRLVFQLPYEEAVPTLDAWIGWARRCRIPRFVKLQRTIVAHRDTILASIEHHLSNGLIESVNTKIRLITRTAFGFASPDALIALAMLNLGGHRPVLPGRT